MTFGGKDNRGPSVAELQRFIRDQSTMLFMLSNGTEIVGQLRWFDETAFQVAPLNGEQPFTILRAAVMAYRRHGSNASAPAPLPAKVAAPEPAAVAVAEAAPKETQSGDSEIRADDIGAN